MLLKCIGFLSKPFNFVRELSVLSFRKAVVFNWMILFYYDFCQISPVIEDHPLLFSTLTRETLPSSPLKKKKKKNGKERKGA